MTGAPQLFHHLGGGAGVENQQLSRKQQVLIFFLPPDPGFRNPSVTHCIHILFSNRCSGPNTEPTKPPLRNPFRRLRLWTGAGLLSAIPNRTTTGSSWSLPTKNSLNRDGPNPSYHPLRSHPPKKFIFLHFFKFEFWRDSNFPILHWCSVFLYPPQFSGFQVPSHPSWLVTTARGKNSSTRFWEDYFLGHDLFFSFLGFPAISFLSLSANFKIWVYL